MFEINKAQTEILRIIFDEEKKIREKTSSHPSKKDSLGITGYQITKKISRGTWYENKDFLQYYQLITKVKTKKTGKQRRKYFKITHLGIFSLLKKIDSSELYKFEIDLKQIFQLIGKHWSDLNSKLNDDLLYLILSKSINQIDLIQSDMGNYKSKDPLLKLVGRKLIEKIELPFDIEETTLNIFTHYTTVENKEKYSKYIKNYNEISNTIIQHVVFLFFFNLLRLKTDEIFLMNTIYSLFKKQQKTKKQQGTSKSKIKYKKIEDNPKIKEYIVWDEQHHKNILSGVKYASKLIKSDDELSSNLKENTELISKKIENVSSNYLKEFDF